MYPGRIFRSSIFSPLEEDNGGGVILTGTAIRVTELFLERSNNKGIVKSREKKKHLGMNGLIEFDFISAIV